MSSGGAGMWTRSVGRGGVGVGVFAFVDMYNVFVFRGFSLREPRDVKRGVVCSRFRFRLLGNAAC